MREKCPAFSTVLRNPTYSVAFYRNFATFSDFKNTLDIFWKNEAFCQKPIFWTFEELILIQSHSEANLLLFRFFIEITFFSKKPSIFLSAKANYWTFWEVFIFQSHLTANLLLLAFFKKFKIFFEKPIFFPKNSPNFLTALRNLTCSVAFYSKFATFTVFSNKTLFSKTHIFSVKKNRFWRLWEIGFFQSHFTANLLVSEVFLKKNSFPKTHLFFSRKT